MKLKINTRSSHKKRSQEMHTVYCWVLIIGFEPLFRWHLHVGSFLVSFLSSSLSSLSLSFIFSFFLFSYSLSFSFSFFFFFILSLSFSFLIFSSLWGTCIISIIAIAPVDPWEEIFGKTLFGQIYDWDSDVMVIPINGESKELWCLSFGITAK